jgi:pyruvate/2-oxoacid:ferredoxin oxidoreductase beta subunit
MSEELLEVECEIPADSFNPVEPFLRTERIPHIWCAGCGIGTTVNCFTRALIASGANLDKVAIVSGIGCTGRVAGYATPRFVPYHARPRHSVRHGIETD